VARVETSAGYDHHDRHVHVHLADERATYYDLVTEFLQAAGKAPDWYWRLVGAFGPHESDKLEEIISTAFEAGAFVSHDHPEDVEFQWVTEEECEEERRLAEEAEIPEGEAPEAPPALNGEADGEPEASPEPEERPATDRKGAPASPFD
jgi:hypothetical protein